MIDRLRPATGPFRAWIAIATGAALLSALGCGSMVEVPSRDVHTADYLQEVITVPSFWIQNQEDPAARLVIPFYVRDDGFPGDVEGDALRAIVEAAVRTWSDALAGIDREVRMPVIYESSGYPMPEIRVDVRFVTRGEAWLGATRYLCRATGLPCEEPESWGVIDVEISVKALSSDRYLSRRDILALTLHEFGHALGISRPGHSDDPDDVMYGHNLDNTWVTLSEGDVATIRALYR